MRKFVKIAFALLALAGTLVLAACGGPKVFHYGKGEPNVTVEQG